MATNTGTAVGYSYQNITAAAPTTTVVRTGSGILHTLVINNPAADGVITVYDGISASGTKIATITQAAALANDQPSFVLYDCVFSTGLTIVTSVAAQDITVTYI
jgi:hypothetical protein